MILLNDRILCEIDMPPPPRSFGILSGRRAGGKSSNSDNPFLQMNTPELLLSNSEFQFFTNQKMSISIDDSYIVNK
jgi:hypothetical protein